MEYRLMIDRQTDRQIDRQTDRQTDRHTDKTQGNNIYRATTESQG